MFLFSHTVAIAEDGSAYVCDGYAKAIWKIAAGENPKKWVNGTPLDNPVGIDWLQGRLYVADPRVQTVLEVDTKGKLSEHRIAGEG